MFEIIENWKILYVEDAYHRFPWYATFQIETPAETFPKFPSVIHIIPYMEVLIPPRATERWRIRQQIVRAS